jgi:hypothetical protein
MMANRSDRNWLIPLALSGSKAGQDNWAPERLAVLGPEALAKTFADVLNAISKDAATAVINISPSTRTWPATSTRKLISRRCNGLFGRLRG